jgi:hypothetical protein
MRRAAVTLATVAMLIASGGCALDPYAKPAPKTPAATSATTAPGRALAQPELTARVVAAPSRGDRGPAAVLYRFATAYGNVSPRTVARQERALAQLAAGPLATQLATEAHAARAQSIRALPGGARVSSTISSLQLAPRAGSQQHGVVILEERLVTDRGVIGLPVTTVFLAGLLDQGGRWQVTSFTAEH